MARVMSKLFGWIIFWTIVHYIKTEEIYDLWKNFTDGVSSEGLLPVSWFLFTYCFLIVIGYPMILLNQKCKYLFEILIIVWMCALAMGVGDKIMETRKQSLWLHLYIGYFGLGIALHEWIGIWAKSQKRYQILILGSINLFSCAVYMLHVITAKEYLPPNAYYGKWYYTLWLVSLFWLVSVVEINNEMIQRLIIRLSSNSLAVYMVPHIPTLFVLSIIRLNNLGTALLLILIFFIGSELLAELFRKMPLLRKLV